MFQKKFLRKMRVKRVDLSSSLYSLFSPSPSPVPRPAEQRPPATCRPARGPSPTELPDQLSTCLATALLCLCSRAMRSLLLPPPATATTCRAGLLAPHPSALLSSLPFASQASLLPPPLLPSLLQAPGRASHGVQSRPSPAISAAPP